ncbi:MAG: class I SAM-dependent methyltransferase [Candidatus Bathyarchaeia archaeon]
MDDFRLPSKLYMLRKTFELDSRIRNKKSIDSLTRRLLLGVPLGHRTDINARLEKFWAREHAYYTTLCEQTGKKYSEYLPGREYTYVLLRDIVLRITGEKQPNVLDGGCGSGIACALLGKKEANATGLDITRSALELAKAISGEYRTCVKLVRGDLTSLPFQDCTFDVVFSLGIFEHCPPQIQNRIFGEFVRVSKRGVLLAVPNKNSPIYQTMSESEFKLMPPSLVYPEEREQFPVDFSFFSSHSGIPMLESSAFHIVPPKIIPGKHLTRESYRFFTGVTQHALQVWNGEPITTWSLVENSCSLEEKAKYGWFSYAIYEKQC